MKWLAMLTLLLATQASMLANLCRPQTIGFETWIGVFRTKLVSHLSA